MTKIFKYYLWPHFLDIEIYSFMHKYLLDQLVCHYLCAGLYGLSLNVQDTTPVDYSLYHLQLSLHVITS